jgi:hypothetical protein
MDAAVTIGPDGHVTVADALIFFRQSAALHIANDVSLSSPGATLKNCHLIGSLPKWWQLRKWLQLLRNLRRFTSPNP